MTDIRGRIVQNVVSTGCVIYSSSLVLSRTDCLDIGRRKKICFCSLLLSAFAVFCHFLAAHISVKLRQGVRCGPPRGIHAFSTLVVKPNISYPRPLGSEGQLENKSPTTALIMDFTFFPLLPLELRSKIWHEAAHHYTRIIEVHVRIENPLPSLSFQK